MDDMKKKDEKKDKESKYEPDRLTEIIGEIGPWQLLWILVPEIAVSFHCWMMMGMQKQVGLKFEILNTFVRKQMANVQNRSLVRETGGSGVS